MASLASETPDAIGWRSTYSILVEVKTSRSDFLRDRKKFHRRKPGYGMGTLRFYLSPPGIITPEDLPDGWGLLYAHKSKIEKVVAPVGNIWSASPEFHHERSKHAEITLLVSALRREQEK